jgi:hypothetical protein
MRNSAAISPRRGPPRLGIAVACLLIAPLAEAADVDFDRDVRPLLAAHCTACHGGVKKAGGISFLAREQAVVAGDSGAEAIVPGDPAASELLRRVTSSDESERMPPPEHGRALAPAEVATLRAWIEGGAGWKPHWSFEPPRDPPLPSVPDAAWPRLPLDAFVAARLAAEGLEPAPAARRRSRSSRPSSPMAVRRIRRRPRRPASGWSIGCSPRRGSASAGRRSGSTWRDTPTPSASRRIRRGPSGRGATG